MHANPFEVRKAQPTTKTLADKRAAYEAVNHALPVEEVQAAKKPSTFDRLVASLNR